MPKILQVCNTDFYLSKFLRPLLLALVDAGMEVHVATEGQGIPADVKAKCKVHSLTFPKTASPLAFKRSIDSLSMIIRSERFDCVNGHNRNASIVSRIAAWRENVPINLYTAHGFYFHDDQSRIAREVTIWIEGLLARITDFTLSQSYEDTQLMVRRRLIAEDRIETIGNGIDVQKFKVTELKSDVERRLRLPAGAFRVVTVGRIVAGKGFADLVRAFGQFLSDNPTASHSELLIVGGNIEADINPASAELRQLIERLGLSDKVRITGLVDNVQDYLRASSLFVSPSYREGMPRSLLEAMCAELPVVATTIRGSREILADGRAGILYEPHDSSTLAKTIGFFFRDPATRSEMAAAGRDLVLSKYSEDAYTLRQVQIIDRLLSDCVARRTV